MFIELSLLLAICFYFLLYFIQQSKKRREDSEKINYLSNTTRNQTIEIQSLNEEVKHNFIQDITAADEELEISHLRQSHGDSSGFSSNTPSATNIIKEKTPIQEIIELKTGVINEKFNHSHNLTQEKELGQSVGVDIPRLESFPYYRVACALSIQRGWKINIEGNLVCVRKGGKKYFAKTNDELVDIFK